MIEKLIYEYVGRKIRQAREASKKTQEDLAQALGASRASVANYESGKQAVSLSDLYKISEYLNVSVREFVPEIDEIRTKAAPERLLDQADDLKEEEKRGIKDLIDKVT